jgi:hypothetical protein
MTPCGADQRDDPGWSAVPDCRSALCQQQSFSTTCTTSLRQSGTTSVGHSARGLRQHGHARRDNGSQGDGEMASSDVLTSIHTKVNGTASAAFASRRRRRRRQTADSRQLLLNPLRMLLIDFPRVIRTCRTSEKPQSRWRSMSAASSLVTCRAEYFYLLKTR